MIQEESQICLLKVNLFSHSFQEKEMMSFRYLFLVFMIDRINYLLNLILFFLFVRMFVTMFLKAHQFLKVYFIPFFYLNFLMLENQYCQLKKNYFLYSLFLLLAFFKVLLFQLMELPQYIICTRLKNFYLILVIFAILYLQNLLKMNLIQGSGKNFFFEIMMMHYRKIDLEYVRQFCKFNHT